MRRLTMRRGAWVGRFGVAAGLAAVLAVGVPASRGAEVSTELPGAILVFPKVTSGADRDTIVQISNATGTRVRARCFYVDGRESPDTGEPLWTATDFEIQLTMQQPAVWVAGDGLPATPPDGRDRDLYPGAVPPVADGFLGELRCVVVDDSESPVSKNALTGDATIVEKTPQTTQKYQALAIPGLAGNDGDNTLLLNDVEYGSCPRVLLLNTFFTGALDPILNVPVYTRLTVVPCSMNLEDSIPGTATLQFEVFNEFEQPASFSVPVTCFGDLDLRDIPVFSLALQGTLVGHARIRPVVDRDVDQGRGVVAIVEETRGGTTAVTAANLHFIGGQLQADVMILPGTF